MAYKLINLMHNSEFGGMTWTNFKAKILSPVVFIQNQKFHI